jgi:cytochrome oxidase Cu insertion factor (SCO1/SenC/PrrC family)
MKRRVRTRLLSRRGNVADLAYSMETRIGGTRRKKAGDPLLTSLLIRTSQTPLPGSAALRLVPWSGGGIHKQRDCLRYVIRALGALAIVVCSLVAVPLPRYASTANYLPDVALIDQSSTTVSLASFRGKPVLVGFIHTMCKGVCQMMTAKMRSVVSAMPAGHSSDVSMLLITTDPSDDQPQQLRQYAQSQDLPDKGWILVTGSQDNIRRVMRLYGVSHQDTDDAMMHVMKLFLIAPDGSIAHVYPGMTASPERVASDIGALSHPHSVGPDRPK